MGRTHLIHRMIFHRTPLFFLLAVFSLIAFVAGYALLRRLKISLPWVVRILGAVILLASVSFGVWMLVTGGISPTGGLRSAGPGMFLLARFGTLLGIIATPIALYAALSWIVRQGYIMSKKRAWKGLGSPLRDLLIFVREQHQFFGIIVIVAASGHMLQYLPQLANNETYEIVTGFVAIGTLGLMVILGLWVWLATLNKKATPKIIRTTHAALSIIFLGTLALHV